MVTKKYLKYEKKLLDEYKRQVLKIERNKYPRKLLIDGPIYNEQMQMQTYHIDTNLSSDQNFYMTRLPLMEYSF